jgi:hypothetical protein
MKKWDKFLEFLATITIVLNDFIIQEEEFHLSSESEILHSAIVILREKTSGELVVDDPRMRKDL